CNDRGVVFFVNVHHLADRRGFRIDDVVSEQCRKGLLADIILRLIDGMAEAEGLALAGVRYIRNVRDGTDLIEEFVLALFTEDMLEFVRDVEVIFDRGLVAARDDEY